jgi:putative endonuclease
MPSSTQYRGTWGEKVASWYLEGQGYKIITTHFTTRFGEIDLIMRDGNEVVFIEVKTRLKNVYGLAEQSVDKQKQKRLKKTILAYISKNNIESFRFDIIAITKRKTSKTISIRHHKALSDIFDH